MNRNIIEQLIKKNLTYKYDVSNNLFIIPLPAKKFGEHQLMIECPFCFSKMKKNGQPFKNAHYLCHYHGDDGLDDDGNYGTRTIHCSDNVKKYWKLEPNIEFMLIGGNMIY